MIRRSLLSPVAVALFATGMVRLPAAPPLTQSGLVAKGVSFPLHGKDPTLPAANIRIEQVTVGAQKRGFLRIAILPLIVGDGVTIRFRAPDASALTEVPATFASLARADRLELRRVEWVSPAPERSLLKAAMVEVAGEAAWRLHGVEFPDGRQVESATLPISGDRAGVLEWDGPHGRQQTSLFLLAPPNPSTSETP